MLMRGKLQVTVLESLSAEFTERFAVNNRNVRSFLGTLGVPPDMIPDLVQDAWLCAWRSREQFSGEKSFNAWLLTIARNRWVDCVRRRRVQKTDQIGEVFDAVSSAATPYMEMETKMWIARSPLIMRQKYFEGLSMEEIAEKCGWTAAATKTRVHRATLRMRKEFYPGKSNGTGEKASLARTASSGSVAVEGSLSTVPGRKICG